MLLVQSTCYGQSLLRHFRELSCPEKKWTICHLFVARRAYRITQEARDATRQLERDSVLDQFKNGGQLDAFRHSYWMARLTQRIGARKSRKLGAEHEQGNFRTFEKSGYEDGRLPDKQSSAMDLFNNEKGIGIGLNNDNCSRSEIQNTIITNIRTGQMIILKRDSTGRFLDCEGRVVTEPAAGKTWDLPYCLVPSNQIP